MSESPVFTGLVKVIAEHFRVDPASIDEKTTALDVNGWDSMTHILLLIRIEDAFNVRFDAKDGIHANNVEELAGLIERTLKEQVS